MKKNLTLFAAVLSVLFYSCKVAKTPIYANEWTLIELNGEITGSGPTLKVDTTGKFSGKGYCNSYNGKFELQLLNKIKSGTEVASTRKFCRATMEYEAAYFKLLKEVDGYSTKKDRLIFTKQGHKILEYKKSAAPDFEYLNK